MTSVSQPTTVPAATDAIFGSYVALANSLVPGLDGIGLFSRAFKARSLSGIMHAERVTRWLGSLGWADDHERVPAAVAQGPASWITAIPLQRSTGELLGVFCAHQTLTIAPKQPLRHAGELAQRLKPLLDCVHRELMTAVSAKSRVQTLTQQTNELEWLFKVTSNLEHSVSERQILERLLEAATQRLGSTVGVLHVPDKRITLVHQADTVEGQQLRQAWTQTESQLVTWAQRHHRPLVVNGAGRSGKSLIPCKVLCVPIVRDEGRVIGVLAFYNPRHEKDYVDHHVFLARHLGRQVASLVEAQFDLMTGLYTRSGLDQMYAGLEDQQELIERSVLYIDIDHMHVANELHGFELGNELIVRIAELLTPPLLPDTAFAARISGDRFAVILTHSHTTDALATAQRIVDAATKLLIGPAQNVFDVSVSCGISSLLPMPEGLARAIAAAESACKSAKSRGRNRVEVYAFEDGSMMRRHSDALAIGQLRSALKANRLLLYAQRIASARDPGQPGGYELLLRLRDTDGTLVAPGPLIAAAQRYQILPTVDRWVVKRALEMLAPYRTMLKTRELVISINVSGQSIGDETFIEQFGQLLKAANLPKNCINIELTEQAAVTNLVKAKEMVIRLKAMHCGFALDDFGTGSNSLTYLKALDVSRVKIDGSFVRDILTDRNSQATVTAIVELARGLKIETVAEYVENGAIAMEVKRMGVDYLQGYAIGKPEPLDTLLAGLAADESKRLHKLFLEM